MYINIAYAFGFAPFKVEQLESHKTLDTNLKMVAFQPLTITVLKRLTACIQRLP